MNDIKEKMIQIGQMAKEATEDMRKLSAADRSRILMNISAFIKINEKKF
tara:strand:- start:155 stop:301 length:147 start_codon:yes stop_codon:yes gene_type:complete